MFVLEVIPITGTAHRETLTYFSKTEVGLGSIIKVPLRERSIPALVISSQDARDLKTSLKTASFELRKIENIEVKGKSKPSAKRFFSSEFIEAAIKTADYFAVNLGAVLGSVVGQAIFDQVLNKSNVKNMPTYVTSGANLGKKKKSQIFAIQGDEADRLSSYKSRIRQAFASKQSVIFCVPTTDYADYVKTHVAKGLEDFTFTLHGNLSPKKFAANWKEIHETKHPVLIITTAPYIACLRSDTAVIILEQEHHRAYKTLRRPYIDFRFFIEQLARSYDYELILGDIFLRPETHERIKNESIAASSPFVWRINSTATTELIDMKQYKGKSFRVLAESTTELIKRTKEESERMIILAVRRGLAPQTVCADCQTIVLCRQCSAPVVLHTNRKVAQRIDPEDLGQESGFTQEESHYFFCHKCGDRRSADETCRNCGSWNLGVIGIGIDLVEEKIRANFPDVNLIRIDSDTTPNITSLRKALAKFQERPGSVLLGTEMMLQYLHETVGYSAVVSLDSLFGLPDFRIGEKIIHILGIMRSLTTSKMIVQTRKTDEKVLDFGLKGNLNQYHEYEAEERKNLHQPPFSIYIKVTLEGQKQRISQEMHDFQKNLHIVLPQLGVAQTEAAEKSEQNIYSFDIFPAFTNTIRGNSVLHGLIRLPNGSWPLPELMNLLRALPPQFTVKVDPDSLL